MSENIYMELFLTSFFQTLGQLTAGSIAAIVGVPLYVYYSGALKNVNYVEEDEDEDDEHFEDTVEERDSVEQDSLEEEDGNSVDS